MIVNNSINININKTNNHLSPQIIEHTMILTVILTYDVGNPGPGLEQAQKCVWVKSVNENIFQPNILF